ncbi:MAG TPA: hypothetical protein VFP20_03120 [Bacteroidales bacterium]|nr:hypothetical protein [Bacteroidales bacterium]
MRGKKVFLLIAICSFAALSCVQQKDRWVTVKGAISHLGSTALYVSYTNAQQRRTIDTIHSSMSGKFNLKVRTSNDLTPITIYFATNKCWTTLFAEPGDHVTLRGNIDYVDMLTIRGGTVNNDLSRFKMQIRDLYKERLDLLKGFYSKENSSEVRLAEINLLLKRSAKDFIRENPESIASVVLIQDFFYQDYDPATNELLGLLKGKASNCKLANKIRENLLNGR